MNLQILAAGHKRPAVQAAGHKRPAVQAAGHKRPVLAAGHKRLAVQAVQENKLPAVKKERKLKARGNRRILAEMKRLAFIVVCFPFGRRGEGIFFFFFKKKAVLKPGPW